MIDAVPTKSILRLCLQSHQLTWIIARAANAEDVKEVIAVSSINSDIENTRFETVCRALYFSQFNQKNRYVKKPANECVPNVRTGLRKLNIEGTSSG